MSGPLAENPDWVPSGVDKIMSNAARVYDYLEYGTPSGSTGHSCAELYLRDYGEVLRFFAGFELVESGLVGCAFWRPTGPGDSCDSTEMNALAYGGVGRKL